MACGEAAHAKCPALDWLSRLVQVSLFSIAVVETCSRLALDILAAALHFLRSARSTGRASSAVHNRRRVGVVLGVVFISVHFAIALSALP